MRKLHSSVAILATLGITVSAAHAEVRLVSDWNDSLKIPAEQWESTKLEKALLASVAERSATNASRKGKAYKPTADLPFQLFVDGMKYYIQPVMFMAKDHPDEVCTPSDSDKTHRYRCEEGQSYKASCHLMLFNAQFENVGIHRFNPDEPYETFCNAVPAIGTADKMRNELLVTFQYFPIDRKLASKVSEIGDGWKRMTSLFRLKLFEGKIEVEEDGSCFGKPNTIETISDARAALKRCRSTAR